MVGKKERTLSVIKSNCTVDSCYSDIILEDCDFVS